MNSPPDTITVQIPPDTLDAICDDPWARCCGALYRLVLLKRTGGTVTATFERSDLFALRRP